MIELKTEIIDGKYIKHWAEDENGTRYFVRQVQTGIEYAEAIDILPCKYVYLKTSNAVIQGSADELNEELQKETQNVE